MAWLILDVWFIQNPFRLHQYSDVSQLIRVEELCAIRGGSGHFDTQGRLADRLAIDQFHRIDTIGTRVNFGKVAFIGTIGTSRVVGNNRLALALMNVA